MFRIYLRERDDRGSFLIQIAYKKDAILLDRVFCMNTSVFTSIFTSIFMSVFIYMPQSSLRQRSGST
jgi:hypothetical protein